MLVIVSYPSIQHHISLYFIVIQGITHMTHILGKAMWSLAWTKDCLVCVSEKGEESPSHLILHMERRGQVGLRLRECVCVCVLITKILGCLCGFINQRIVTTLPFRHKDPWLSSPGVWCSCDRFPQPIWQGGDQQHKAWVLLYCNEEWRLYQIPLQCQFTGWHRHRLHVSYIETHIALKMEMTVFPNACTGPFYWVAQIGSSQA